MPPTRHSDASRPRLAHTPLHHPTPKVARNSATRKINTAHKRCNSNGPVSKFERFTWELRATFFGNHAQQCPPQRPGPSLVTRARIRPHTPPTPPQSRMQFGYPKIQHRPQTLQYQRPISKLEIHARELHATFLGNHPVAARPSDPAPASSRASTHTPAQ